MTDINDFGRTSFVTHTTGLKERLEKCEMIKYKDVHGNIIVITDESHLFVTKDKNGKDVFVDDSVLHDSYSNEKSGKVIFDEDLTYKVRWTLTKHKSFIRSDVIELIEDKDDD